MLDDLLELLSKRETSEIVFNQYKNEGILNNVKVYLEYLISANCRILFIGEAPGYKGCRLTGIPFTSGFIIKNAKHQIFQLIGDKIKLQKVVSENTATILWDFLDYDRLVPILWNAFPFHPHEKNILESNRTPDVCELQEGSKYLKIIYNIFKPYKLCSLGRVGERVLKNLFPNIEIIYVRHPSHGGKKEFENGISKIYKIT